MGFLDDLGRDIYKQVLNLKNQDINVLFNELANLEDKLKHFQNKISEKDAKVKELKSEISIKDKDLHNIQQELNTVNQKFNKLKKDIAFKDNEINNLMSNLKENAVQLDELENNLFIKENEVQKLENKCNILNNKLSSKDGEILDLQNKLKYYSSNKNSIVKDFEKLKKRYLLLNETLSKTKEDLNNDNEFVFNFLNCFDNVDYMLDNKKSLEMLKDRGLKEFSTIGKRYNQDIHFTKNLNKNGIMPPIIIGESEKGYFADNKVIKKANVVVSNDEIFALDVPTLNFHDQSKPILGINFGDKNAIALYYNGYSSIVISPSYGSNLEGKVFANGLIFDNNQEVLFGNSIKLDDCSSENQSIFGIDNILSIPKREIYGEEYLAEDILKLIFEKIRLDSEEFLGEKVENVSITIPPYVTNEYMTTMKLACENAGFHNVGFVYDSIAACLGCINNNQSNKLNILVYDLGDTKLDVSLVELNNGNFNLKSVSNNMDIGGKHITNLIRNHLFKKFKSENNIDVMMDSALKFKFNLMAEETKIKLSSLLNFNIIENDLLIDDVSFSMNIPFSRIELEKLIKNMIYESGEVIEEALSWADLKKEDVDKIILVGGSTKIPFVKKFVEEYMEKTVEKRVNATECSCYGAIKYSLYNHK